MTSKSDYHAQIGREEGRGPLGTAGTSASLDNDRVPKKTPGTLGVCDESGFEIAEFGKNPCKLSGQLELHIFKRADMAISTPTDSKGAYCLYEYNGQGHYYAAKELTYPHGHKDRGYYQEGDVILIQEVIPALLERIHPEAAALLGSGGLLMLANSLDLRVTIGWRIISMTSHQVAAELGILFGDNLFCAVDDITCQWILRVGKYGGFKKRISPLEPTFREVRRDRSGWKFVKKIAPVIANIATGALQGTARRAIRGIAFRATKAQVGKRVRRVLALRMLAGAGKHILASTLAFCKAAAKKFVAVQLEKPGGGLNPGDAERIVVVGAEAFVSNLISALGDSLVKNVPDAGEFRRWVASRVAKELLRMVPNITKVLISAHAEAFDELARLSASRNVDLRSDKYQELLAKKLNEKLANPIKSAAQNLFLTSGGLGDEL